MASICLSVIFLQFLTSIMQVKKSQWNVKAATKIMVLKTFTFAYSNFCVGWFLNISALDLFLKVAFGSLQLRPETASRNLTAPRVHTNQWVTFAQDPNAAFSEYIIHKFHYNVFEPIESRVQFYILFPCWGYSNTILQARLCVSLHNCALGSPYRGTLS